MLYIEAAKPTGCKLQLLSPLSGSSRKLQLKPGQKHPGQSLAPTCNHGALKPNLIYDDIYVGPLDHKGASSKLSTMCGAGKVHHVKCLKLSVRHPGRFQRPHD